MQPVEALCGAVMAALLAGCASAPPPVTARPVEVPATLAAPAPGVPASAAAVAPDAQRAFDAARADLRAGRTAEAERAFSALAAAHADLGGAQANLGLIYRNAGKPDESVAALEKAVQASPAQPLFLNQLGISYRHQGAFAKARDAYERALALDANFADAHLNLGVLLDLYLADPAAALAHYERYVALAPAGDPAVGKWVADLKVRQKSAVALVKAPS
jgi:tetratricopeptide (TPR) repeat protein